MMCFVLQKIPRLEIFGVAFLKIAVDGRKYALKGGICSQV